MSTAIQTQTPAGPVTVRQRLEGQDFRKAVASVLPKHLTPDRFVRIAIMAMTKTPKLAECTQASLFGALMTLSQLGLEPDGRRAHIIPFRNNKTNTTECQLIIDWKGLAELAMRSGQVSNLHADVVSDGDLFTYSMGRVTDHVPWFLRRDKEKPAEPGPFVAAYALATFKDGSSKAEVLSIGEVDGIRARSKSPDTGPWATDYAEMAKKTAFRRLAKWLPLSPEFRDAVDADDGATGTSGGFTLDLTETAPALPPTDTVTLHLPNPANAAKLDPEPTPQAQLDVAVTGQGFTFDEFRQWAAQSGQIADPDSIGSFDDLSPTVAKRILRIKADMLRAMVAAKNGGAK